MTWARPGATVLANSGCRWAGGGRDGSGYRWGRSGRERTRPADADATAASSIRTGWRALPSTVNGVGGIRPAAAGRFIEILPGKARSSWPRSGLGNPEKLIGFFLLAGPTGVGKTEVTGQLSQLLGVS